MAHYPGHLIAGAAALVLALAISSFTANRLVRRKLRLSIFLLGAYVVGHIVAAVRPDLWPADNSKFYSFEQLALAAALINLFVVALLNPVREDRVPDRFPSIVQDAVVIGVLLLMATFAFGTEFVATSAVSAVVLGFALQDTLGNAIAGLAIQSEKPFKVGHWVKVGDFEGRITEVTWRATKLRTKQGNFAILPNNIVAKEAIINFSEPALPLRLEVEVGASYMAPPNKVKAAMMEALRHCSRVLAAPAPDVVLVAFDASAITYRARFWIDDYAADEVSRDEVRTAIFYAFQRHEIEIPYPIQVEYERSVAAPDAAARHGEEEGLLAGVDLLSSLPPEARTQIALSAPMAVYGSGETIVRQAEQGQSMFVVLDGEVRVVLEPRRDE